MFACIFLRERSVDHHTHTYTHIYREREMEGEKEMKQSKFKRVCVFCGSSPGKKSSYKDAAIELGRELVFLPLFYSVPFLYHKSLLSTIFRLGVYTLT